LTIADIDAIGYSSSYIENPTNYLNEDSLKVLKEYPVVMKYYNNLKEVFGEYLQFRSDFPW
jgi:hypothetical protein